MIGPTNGICNCINGRNNSFSNWCSTCSIGVMQAIFSNDYLFININFNYSITITNSSNP